MQMFGDQRMFASDNDRKQPYLRVGELGVHFKILLELTLCDRANGQGRKGTQSGSNTFISYDKFV